MAQQNDWRVKLNARIYLHRLVEDHTDPYTGEINCTAMAEELAMEFDLYGSDDEIQEWVYDYAVDVAEKAKADALTSGKGVPFYLRVYVMYVNYGKGITYRTGPVELRHRVGLWAHFYVRDHPPSCQCLNCFRRFCFGPVEAIPEGRKPGYMYPLF